MTAADRYQPLPTTFQFSTAGSSSGDIAIPVMTSLNLAVYCTGTSGAATCALVFNADTGSNYVNRFLSLPTASSTWANTANASAASFIFTASQTLEWIAYFKIANFLTSTKVIKYFITLNSGGVGTGLASMVGGGEWVNTTSRISQIRMQTSANNFNIGSGFQVWGGEGL